MRVCFFGTYNTEEGYPRVRVLMEGLRRIGHEVTECRETLLADAASKLKGITRPAVGLRLAFRLTVIHLRLGWRFLRAPRPDLMVVGYPGHLDMLLARMVASLRSVPLVFDAFVSLHDTVVEDRALAAPGSPTAHVLALIDRAACRMADLVILDTEAHIRFFVRRFGLPRHKFCRVLIGEDDRVFCARDLPAGAGEHRPLEVLYFGTLLPLHGVPTILAAAQRLADDGAVDRGSVRFTIAGEGQLGRWLDDRYPPERTPHVRWIRKWLSYAELIPEIERADVCLGVFGTTAKAGRVVPLKVYGALAMGKALVTGDTPGARELLEENGTALLVPPGDPEALAGALQRLAGDRTLVRRLGENASRLFSRRLTPERVAATFVEDLADRGMVRPAHGRPLA